MNINKDPEDMPGEQTLFIANRDSFILITKILSIGLFFGSILNLVGYFFWEDTLLESLIVSGVLLFLGSSLQIILRMKVSDKLVSYFLILIGIFVTPLFSLKYIEIGGLTVWALPFILIIISLIFTTPTMLIWVGLSALLTQIIVWIFAPNSPEIIVDDSDYMIRIGFLAIGIVSAYFINRLYVEKLKENAFYTQKIKELAYHDFLTDLPNRLLFNDRLQQAILAAKCQQRNVAVMFMDLDNFKMVNDTLGHEQGDLLLQKIAWRLKELIREGDTVSRIGGDEFLILAPNISENGISELAGRIMGSFVQPFTLGEQNIYANASMGISVYPLDGETPDLLIKHADMAMYKVKDKGKNQYLLCSQGMKAEIEESINLANELYHAMERQELVLYYQPQICNGSEKIVGLEALIRWNHPEFGLISPERFIPLAEKTGLINPIGEWVLRTACRQNKMWQETGFPAVRIAVNLSVFQLQTADIVHKVGKILQETGLNPKYLELEVSESMAMQEKNFIIEILESLKKLGVSIALDNFGALYSSMDYLRQLSVDRIKIAMPFIHGITSSAKDEAITKAIIALARNMGLNALAEGVETKEQLAFLNRQMCDEMQGYYYYKAMPKEEIEQLLQSQSLS